MMTRKRRGWLAAPLMALALFALLAASIAQAALATTGRRAGPTAQRVTSDYTYAVDSTGDASDDTLGDHLCKTKAGDCTLRAAIQQGDFNCGSNASISTTIDFNLGFGPQTIVPGTGLPAVGCPMLIDGTSQPGYAGTPIIELDGEGTQPNLYAGLFLNIRCACPGTVKGFVINRWLGGGISIGGHGPWTMQNNYIGTDISGSVALGNRGSGISVAATSGDGGLIGGTSASERNVLSGNSQYGVAIQGTRGNVAIEGNYIGTDASGTMALGNAQAGVSVNAPNTTVGGNVPGAGNVISGNGGDGIGTFGWFGIVIEANLIGTKADAVSPLGNATHGVHLASGGVILGGPDTEDGNVIAFNGHDGVAVTSGTGQAILGNSIFSNGTPGLPDSIGIDLASCGPCFGPTPNDLNDPDSGPNNYQNYPVLTSAVSRFSATTVSGTLNSLADTTFLIQFYASPSCDPSGYGEGQTVLGSIPVTTVGNDAAFTAKLSPPVTPGQVITTTATDPSGNTSEFSVCQTVTGAQADISVTNMDSPDPVHVGSPLTYTINASNQGPDKATGVKVVDKLPAGVTFDSVTASQGSCVGGPKVSCDLGKLAPGKSATVTIVVTPNEPGRIKDVASISAKEFDPDLSNDSAKAVTTVKS